MFAEPSRMPKAVSVRRGELRGFTLLEMLIVLAILVLIMGLTWPAVGRLLNRSRMKDAAKQVRTELAEARLRAIESGIPQVFRFQPGTGFFEVRPKEEETVGPAVLKSALDQMSNEAVDTEPITGAVIVDPTAYEKYLPEGMLFVGQEVAKEPAAGEDDEGMLGMSTAQLTEQKNWSEPVVFYPNGRTSNARIRLTDKRRYSIDVSLRGLTGAVRIGPTNRIQPASEGGMPGGGTFVAEGLPGVLPVEAQP